MVKCAYHAFECVHEHSIGWEFPVGLGYIRGRNMSPACVQLSSRLLHLSDHWCISMTSWTSSFNSNKKTIGSVVLEIWHAWNTLTGFIKVAHKPVHRRGLEKVQNHHKRYHWYLRQNHHKARQLRCFEHLHADEKMHAFILCFLQKCVNPSMIFL